MSGSSGSNGKATAAAARAQIMLECVADLECEYDGARVQLKAGLDRVGGDHELAERFPEHFRPVHGDTHGSRSVEQRMVDGRQLRHPARTRSLSQELAVRSARLAQLKGGEGDGPAPRSAEDSFWAGVAELLGSAEQERQDKRELELLDALDTSRARSLRAEREELASWLEGE